MFYKTFVFFLMSCVCNFGSATYNPCPRGRIYTQKRCVGLYDINLPPVPYPGYPSSQYRLLQVEPLDKNHDVSFRKLVVNDAANEEDDTHDEVGRVLKDLHLTLPKIRNKILENAYRKYKKVITVMNYVDRENEHDKHGEGVHHEHSSYSTESPDLIADNDYVRNGTTELDDDAKNEPFNLDKLQEIYDQEDEKNNEGEEKTPKIMEKSLVLDYKLCPKNHISFRGKCYTINSLSDDFVVLNDKVYFALDVLAPPTEVNSFIAQENHCIYGKKYLQNTCLVSLKDLGESEDKGRSIWCVDGGNLVNGGCVDLHGNQVVMFLNSKQANHYSHAGTNDNSQLRTNQNSYKRNNQHFQFRHHK